MDAAQRVEKTGLQRYHCTVKIATVWFMLLFELCVDKLSFACQSLVLVGGRYVFV